MHEVVWSYYKDGSYSKGDDCGWLDQVTWTQSTPVTLSSIAVGGATSVTSGGSATYTCTATYSDGTTKTVTPTWSIASGATYASITSAGKLTAATVTSAKSVTVMASYTEGDVTRTATKTVTINPLTVSDFQYEVVDGKAVITNYAGTGGAVVIPSKIDGYTVSGIDKNAFYQKTAITSVVIPEGVTSIGNQAFASCSGLTSVTVSNFNWYDANREPFYDCTKLTTLVASCAPPSWSVSSVFPCLKTVRCKASDVTAWKTAVPSASVSAIAATYTVAYYKNDGSGVTAKQAMTCERSQQLKWVNSGLGWTNPSGKTFLGWSVSATTGVAKYNNGGSVKDLAAEGKTCNLYAVWYDPKTDYVVKYYRNTGGTDTTTAQQCLKAGVASSLAWKDSGLGWANPSGKAFVGWGAAANATVAKYANGQGGVKDLAQAGRTIALYAVWRPTNAYVVTFHRNISGDATTASQWISRGVSTSLAWKDSGLGWTVPGYANFLGWAETASGAVKYANGAKVKDLAAAGGTKHLYAKWKANTYKVRFHYNYGSTEKTADQSFTYGTARQLTYLDSGLKWAHPLSAAFLGWSTTAEGTATYANGATVSNLTTVNNGVVHLYAKWALATVRFHYNYGTDKTASQYFKKDAAQRLLWKDSQLKWATPSGKLFVGWGTAKAAAVARYANGESVKNPTTVGGTLHLYAVWAAADSYIVKFYRNYTTSDATCAYQGVARTVATRLAWKDSALGWANPSGRTFLGWSRSRTATTGTYANGQQVTGLGAKGATVALYAVWSTVQKVSGGTRSVASETVASETASAPGDCAFTPGYYCGTFTDGSGTFDLLVDAFDEDGVATAYLVATTEDGVWSEECEATVVGGALVLVLVEASYVVTESEGVHVIRRTE